MGGGPSPRGLGRVDGEGPERRLGRCGVGCPCGVRPGGVTGCRARRECREHALARALSGTSVGPVSERRAMEVLAAGRLCRSRRRRARFVRRPWQGRLAAGGNGNVTARAGSRRTCRGRAFRTYLREPWQSNGTGACARAGRCLSAANFATMGYRCAISALDAHSANASGLNWIRSEVPRGTPERVMPRLVALSGFGAERGSVSRSRGQAYDSRLRDAPRERGTARHGRVQRFHGAVPVGRGGFGGACPRPESRPVPGSLGDT